MNKLAIYIHWPFCLSKCPYCDFNSRPVPDVLDEETWAQAYGRELFFYAQRLGDKEISSIYFGGGTPSLMRAQTASFVLNQISKFWPVAPDCEITIEANPSTAESEKFRAFRAAGINRLSLGVQSFDDEALRFLGRVHDADAARRAIIMAGHVFDRFSFDLIYARAGQTIESWRKELSEALSFAPSHLSLYQLTIEEGTAFYKRAKNETLQSGEELAADMFEETQKMMGQAGLPAYEISNHARVGQESRHNLTYWHYDDYIGVGPGAHGRFAEGSGWIATENHRQPDRWLRQVEEKQNGLSIKERLDAQTAQREALMMGLRLRQGIEAAAWQGKFGQNLFAFLPSDRLKELSEQGLIVADNLALRASRAGLQRLNALLLYLLGENER